MDNDTPAPETPEAMAEEFEKLNETAETTEPTAEIPTVDDSQELKPVPQVAEPAQPDYTAERMQYLNVIAQLQEQIKAGQPRKPEPTPEKPLSIEELDAIWKTDPIKAMRLAAMSSPEVKALQDKVSQFDRAEAQRAEQAFGQRIDSQESQVRQKYADFQPGTPVYNAALNFVKQNHTWLRNVASENPNFNVVEHAYRQVAFDLVQAQKNAQAQKLVDKRGKAGSVKPGGTAPTTPASGSVARDAASDLANNGTVVPDEWVAAAEKAMRRYS